MANSAFSNLSGRAGGTFSNLRNRFGGSNRAQDRYDGYDEYGYGEYGYDDQVGDPYDDIDDAAGIGEVRTRATSSSSRYHPPLLSFDEARVNTYVPDRLLRDPLERRDSTRGFRRPGADYTPRVRDAVNMGRSSEYEDAGGGPQPAADTPAQDAVAAYVAPAPPNAAPAPPSPPYPAAAPDAQAYDPYAAFKGGGVPAHAPTRKVKVVAPVGYGEVESIARALKAGDLVVLVLTRTPGELAKRILDFSFGVASALDASVDSPAEKVFVVSRGQGLTEAERGQLQSQGVIL